MSRKHFRLLAEAISEIENDETRKAMCRKIGEVCAQCNNYFNWSIWCSACNVEYSQC